MSEAIATPEETPAPDAAAAPESNTESPAQDGPGGGEANSGEPEAGNEPAAKAGEGQGDAPEPIAPSEYKDFVLPEGYAPSGEALTAFKSWAAEQKLSQVQAQAFIEYDASRLKERGSQVEQALKQQEQEWSEVVRKDPVLGKSPHVTSERVEAAKKFFLGEDKDVAEFLSASGWDKHPGFLRLMYRAHDAIQHMSPDSFGGGAGGTERKLTLAERMVPEMVKR